MEDILQKMKEIKDMQYLALKVLINQLLDKATVLDSLWNLGGLAQKILEDLIEEKGYLEVYNKFKWPARTSKYNKFTRFRLENGWYELVDIPRKFSEEEFARIDKYYEAIKGVERCIQFAQEYIDEFKRRVDLHIEAHKEEKEYIQRLAAMAGLIEEKQRRMK